MYVLYGVTLKVVRCFLDKCDSVSKYEEPLNVQIWHLQMCKLAI